jgi:ABC-2 type transport system ATP-binding protein
LAATLAAETPLVILDEPTANLDPTVRSEVIAIVQDAKQAGRTVMFSSHVMSEVEEVCDRVMILRSGQLVHTQCMAELRRKHRILVTLRGPLHDPPAELTSHVHLDRHSDSLVTIETASELAGLLAGLLAWLARQPIEEIRIEPIGLRSIYDRFHGIPPRTRLHSE